jgi:hypothetical protein
VGELREPVKPHRLSVLCREVCSLEGVSLLGAAVPNLFVRLEAWTKPTLLLLGLVINILSHLQPVPLVLSARAASNPRLVFFPSGPDLGGVCRRECWCAGRQQPAEADAGAGRAAVHWGDHPGRVPQVHREGPRAGAPIPAGVRGPALRGGHRLHPQGAQGEVRTAGVVRETFLKVQFMRLEAFST